jgi:ankyrin repeat protein
MRPPAQNGYTALHLAAYRGYDDIAAVLLRLGDSVDPRVTDKVS